MKCSRTRVASGIACMAGACLVAVAQPAQAITPINAVSINETGEKRLLVEWEGSNLDNGNYDAEFEIPNLVHWAIGDIVESTPAGGGLMELCLQWCTPCHQSRSRRARCSCSGHGF
jgi:hypothetical protein